MSTSTSGAGLITAPAIVDIDKKVLPNLIHFPDASASADPQIPTNFQPESVNSKRNSNPPLTTSKPRDVAAAVANFRPTHKEVITGIAPHVYDERRTKSRRRRSLNGARRERSVTRRPSASFDFYQSGMHGSAGPPTHGGGLSRRSSRSSDGFNPRPVAPPTITYNTASSLKWSASSPLRISAVIAVDDVDKLFADQDQEQGLSVKNESEANTDSASVTLPTLADHRRRKSRLFRLELIPGKRNGSGDSDSSPPSSTDGVCSRKPKWRIDIQVLRSIGLKIKSSKK
ncbi:hypothetical protein D9757_006720 [Collybiopsis confluens]|uniref:Uncharacterized protein n=1 Tax=Collybiopsis confluens TaxID=2823264 RepID=A0A8H5M9D1_9AGAR|nr:hypothetical protein D9757_006720 [Collybiopsis confluens]